MHLLKKIRRFSKTEQIFGKEECHTYVQKVVQESGFLVNNEFHNLKRGKEFGGHIYTSQPEAVSTLPLPQKFCKGCSGNLNLPAWDCSLCLALFSSGWLCWWDPQPATHESSLVFPFNTLGHSNGQTSAPITQNIDQCMVGWFECAVLVRGGGSHKDNTSMMPCGGVSLAYFSSSQATRSTPGSFPPFACLPISDSNVGDNREVSIAHPIVGGYSLRSTSIIFKRLDCCG